MKDVSNKKWKDEISYVFESRGEVLLGLSESVGMISDKNMGN